MKREPACESSCLRTVLLCDCRVGGSMLEVCRRVRLARKPVLISASRILAAILPLSFRKFAFGITSLSSRDQNDRSQVRGRLLNLVSKHRTFNKLEKFNKRYRCLVSRTQIAIPFPFIQIAIPFPFLRIDENKNDSPRLHPSRRRFATRLANSSR